jgi:hypothetical protein
MPQVHDQDHSGVGIMVVVMALFRMAVIVVRYRMHKGIIKDKYFSRSFPLEGGVGSHMQAQRLVVVVGCWNLQGVLQSMADIGRTTMRFNLCSRNDFGNQDIAKQALFQQFGTIP